MSDDLWAEIEKAVMGGVERLASIRTVVEADAALDETERQMMLGRIDSYLHDFAREAQERQAP